MDGMGVFFMRFALIPILHPAEYRVNWVDIAHFLDVFDGRGL
jgi:hypothetical protein